jgi:hypothetical protein
MIRQYYKDADAGFDSTIDVGVILTIRWVAIIGQGAALLFTHLFLQLDLPLLPALFVISLSVAGESVANHAKPAKPSTPSA